MNALFGHTKRPFNYVYMIGLIGLLVLALIIGVLLATNQPKQNVITINTTVPNQITIQPSLPPSPQHEEQANQIALTPRTNKTAAISSTVFIPQVSISPSSPSVPVSSDWAMVAANPQRTSWSPSEPAANMHIEWYRPIDAYIPPNFQVIAANNLLYISSARGLYALQYDTGQLAWRYDTEIPLGNSPTIASVNGISVAVVGGYDKKIHAFNALTGQSLWEFGGAQAGYDANPLVIANVVYVGNRDGYFYAINATNGQLIWQYPAANQSPIGPIHLSPAYNDGTLYFATDYNYAYALNLNGTLKWKSQKLIGDGYNSYWPAIYTDPTSGKDYVILAGNIAYREMMRPGTYSYDNSETFPYGIGLATGYVTATLRDAWATGKTILDYSASAAFFEQKPWQRIYTILDGTTGSEYTTDFDHDGKPEYLPVWPIANPSTQAPPVVSSEDGLIYFDNIGPNNSGYVMGWKFGTPYFALTSLRHAADEPQVMSAGGNYLFRDLCCSRVGDYTLFSNLSSNQALWNYNLSSVAPGYDQQLYYLQQNYLENISAQYGNVNGIYGYHGDQNPLVPYNGKVYVIRGNSVLAFGSGTARGKLALLSSTSTSQSVVTPSTTELTTRLETEISKIVNAGLLKPGYYDDSQFGFNYYLLDNYFDNPADTLYTLSIAYPYLSTSLQTQVKNYITNSSTGIYTLYFKNGFTNRIGWNRGVQRDSVTLPSEVATDMQSSDLADNYNWKLDETLSWNYALYIHANPNNFYALYKYAQNVAPENVQSIYQLAVNELTTGDCLSTDCTVVPPSATDSALIQKPYELNAYLAGYVGFLKLQELAGKTTQDSSLRTKMTNEYNRLLALRLNNFSKDTPFTTVNNGYGKNMINISRNFIWLTPEVATQLRSSKLSAVQQALTEYNTVGPYWFVSRFNAANAESGFQNLYDYPSLFAAKAWILQDSRAEMSKWLDAPAFQIGDLFYIQNLVATIQAP
jgi:outer membrane protein assembly factor BamB